MTQDEYHLDDSPETELLPYRLMEVEYSSYGEVELYDHCLSLVINSKVGT